jgi:hypothetical protein
MSLKAADAAAKTIQTIKAAGVGVAAVRQNKNRKAVAAAAAERRKYGY